MNRVIKFRAWDEFLKYEIGEDGSVWTTAYKNTKQRREMKKYLDKDGYEFVILVNNKKRYKRKVHRMVAKCFIPNPLNKPQVNHLNGIRNDNRVENLEWCTNQENTIHGYKSNGRKVTDRQKMLLKEKLSGVKNPRAKVNESNVLSIRKLRSEGVLLKVIAKEYGLSTAQVSAIARGKFWA